MTSEPKTCSKCGGQQKEDRWLQALGCDLQLVRGIGVLDDDIQTLYREKCGYIELSRDEKKTY